MGLKKGSEPVRIDVFTIFPGLVDGFCRQSLLGRARETGLLDLRCHDLRDHTTDVHRTVDDSPFGGGAGMVLRPEPASGPSRRWIRPARCSSWAPGGGASTRPDGPPPGLGRRVQPAGRDATRVSTTGSGSTWSTGSSRSATTRWLAGRWRPASSSRPSAAPTRGRWATSARPSGSRSVIGAGRRSYRQLENPIRPASSRSPIYLPGDVPGLGGPGGPALGGPRPRRAVAQRPGPPPHVPGPPRPDRGPRGAHDEERALLEEFEPVAYP